MVCYWLLLLVSIVGWDCLSFLLFVISRWHWLLLFVVLAAFYCWFLLLVVI